MSEHAIYLNSLDAAEKWAERIIGTWPQGQHVTDMKIAAHCVLALRQKLAEAESENKRLHDDLDSWQGVAESSKNERDILNAKLYEANDNRYALATQVLDTKAALATASADCAAMREALLGLIEVAENHHEERKCAVIGAGTMMNASFAQPMVVGWFDALVQNSKAARAALTRHTGQAILDRLKLAEDVADSCGDHVDCVDQYYSREALAAYRAARKANTRR